MSAMKKQGNLFSFFHKVEKQTNSPLKDKTLKPPPDTVKNNPANGTKCPPKKVQPKPSKSQEELVKKVRLGSRVSVFWEDDDVYYDARVTGADENESKSMFTLLYDDGVVETIDLTEHKFRILDAPDGKSRKSVETRKRVIDDSDEEEHEHQDVEVESGSDFNVDEESEEEEDSMMVVEDDEDSYNNPSLKRLKKKFKITLATSSEIIDNKVKPQFKHSTLRACSSTDDSKESEDNNSTNSHVPSPNPLIGFSSIRTEKKSPQTTKKTFPKTMAPKVVTPFSKSHSVALESSAPMWKDGAVNPAGSHLHNHLSFLKADNIKDSKMRKNSDPSYNPRTLFVDHAEIEKVSSSKLTPAQRQWWDIKAEYYDTVLLFKTGKFYEMFHMDADVGVKELGFVYMKGSSAHSGFPEAAYGNMSSKLVNRGYKVARVEQTETPQMLADRKKHTRKGQKKPQVVNREVCSVLSQGTRTFCFLDDTKILDRGNNFDGNNLGPLLSVREQVSEDGAHVEYGVTIIDAIRSCVTMGQFADDVLRSRMYTLLSTFEPSEILIASSVSKPLLAMLRSLPKSTLLEEIKNKEEFPKSTALDPKVRDRLERKSPAHPWDSKETVSELHRCHYFPRSSKSANIQSHSRWPEVLKACIDGKAALAISSLGAGLFYLQRSLVDEEIISMGNFKAYIPPVSPTVEPEFEQEALTKLSDEGYADISNAVGNHHKNVDEESGTNHLLLDGTTLQNLEILTNQHDGSANGSLWKKLNHTKSPHGSRLLRAWLLRPLFHKVDIDRRADAVEELSKGGSACLAMNEASKILSKCPDLEQLLSRVHSMGMISNDNEDVHGAQASSHHPNDRAVLYEGDKYMMRKVGDFSRLLNGLRNADKVSECFSEIELHSPLLQKITKKSDEGGSFPSSLSSDLQWFFDNFDCDKAVQGTFEPSRGVDPLYDAACDAIIEYENEFEDYKNEMCSRLSCPKQAWKYINTKETSKDKYLIELPVQVAVPHDFLIKGKRGSGTKQVNKYRTSLTEKLVENLEKALEEKDAGKARGMKLMFAKFDALRPIWAAASTATAMLDALGSLAKISSMPGYTRPHILNCCSLDLPKIEITKGFHPCVDVSQNGGNFIPNDLSLGGSDERILLLSGPNMGGKSTLLRQTCLITILAQIGSYVPAESCVMTPIDRIFTRLGASDRILSGQSTFFVELAETAAALRGSTRRSLVIMDELGRGTSTFDGTAIAHASVKHLVERNRCLALFATHYHSLLEDWKDQPDVRLGHMECIVHSNEADEGDCNITFLYTLGEGGCPKSFGINVARLAALPAEVLKLANELSLKFEREHRGDLEEPDDVAIYEQVKNAVARGDLEEVEKIWENISLKEITSS